MFFDQPGMPLGFARLSRAILVILMCQPLALLKSASATVDAAKLRCLFLRRGNRAIFQAP